MALGLVGVVGLTGAMHAEIGCHPSSRRRWGLLPILKDNGQLDTKLGSAVLTMALSVSCARSSRWLSCSVAEELWLRLEFWAIFTVFAVIFRLPSARLHPGSGTRQLIVGGSETTAQITVRLVVLLLISLGGLAIAFDLDVVLGAFAAGFVLRRALPEGDESLEHKLEGVAFGLLIPIFFHYMPGLQQRRGSPAPPNI